jgi:hypothetical protein
VQTTYQYDAIGRLYKLTNDPKGNLALKNIYTLIYNPAGQIVTKAISQDSFAWTGAVSANSSFIANGLNCYRKVATVTNTCDKNGNLIIDGTDTWTYDTDNRLVDALPVAPAKAGSHNAVLRYDPLGRLYEVTGYANTDSARLAAISVRRFLYGGDELLAEYTGPGTMTARYVHGADGAADDPLAWYSEFR